MRAVLLLALLPGCDRLFGLVHVDEVALDAGGDARTDADTPGDAPGDAVTPTHSDCPLGFDLPYENSRYRAYGIGFTWHNAQAFCMSLKDPRSTKHVHLAVLTDDLERSHVYTNVAGSAGALWIGLSDTRVEGAFQWVSTQQVSYPPASGGPWGASEPSTGPADDCVVVRASTTDFDAMLCSTPNIYVCECDDFATAPTHFE